MSYNYTWICIFRIWQMPRVQYGHWIRISGIFLHWRYRTSSNRRQRRSSWSENICENIEKCTHSFQPHPRQSHSLERNRNVLWNLWIYFYTYMEYYRKWTNIFLLLVNYDNSNYQIKRKNTLIGRITRKGLLSEDNWLPLIIRIFNSIYLYK